MLERGSDTANVCRRDRGAVVWPSRIKSARLDESVLAPLLPPGSSLLT
jgi:hypothetical protein